MTREEITARVLDIINTLSDDEYDKFVKYLDSLASQDNQEPC